MIMRAMFRSLAVVATVSATAMMLPSAASAQWWGEPAYERGYRPYSWRYQDRFRARQADPFAQANQRNGRQRWYSEDWQDDDADADEPRPRRRPGAVERDDDDDRDEADARRGDEETGDEVASGGARPDVIAKAPPSVPFPSSFKPGSIVIDQSKKKLYYVLSDDEALRYDISVGREGFSWTGSEKVSRIADWPDWHPPAEMRERDPKLPKKMTGGIKNPLGAKAIYLGNTLYRIHGTNDPKSIGTAASSGCIRMYNGHVVHLSAMAGVGTTVHVVSRLPKTMASN